MIDTAKLASELGKTDNDAFKAQVSAAVAELERLLGYPLCGTTEPEERIFSYHGNLLWQRVHPLYGEPTNIVIVRGNREETVSEYQLGQNGHLQGTWYNALKLCKGSCGVRCSCYVDLCDYIKVTATWGFGAPEVVEESGAEDVTRCTIPADLYNIISEAVKAGTNAKNDIQSENTGTRSYSKFAASYQSVWQKFAGVIDYYRIREPRF